MTYEEFEALLKAAKLTKKEFATATGLTQASVTNWKMPGKKPSSWVRSWLENYIELEHTRTLLHALHKTMQSLPQPH